MLFSILGIFLLTIVTSIVDYIGKTEIATYIYNLYLRLVGSKDFNQLIQTRAKIQETQKQKNSISAQDEYAKWTKLNRTYETLKKQSADLENKIAGDRKYVVNKLQFGLGLLFGAPLLVLKMFKSRKVLAVLPQGVFPWAAEKYLALPWLQCGSVGVGAWGWAVARVVLNIRFIVKILLIDEVVEPFESDEGKFEKETEVKTDQKSTVDEYPEVD